MKDLFYILNEWINEPTHEKRIRELLEELHSDLKCEDSLTKNEVINELKAMKENKIIDVFLK